ncbi:aldehyde ferredoxin oxidoreductase family protein [Thermodesulfobacteriota bacterium]
MDSQILRVDLTSEKISKEPVSPELRRKYLGGEGVNTRLLWEHFLRVDPKIDPLSPDNVLIAGMGPLGGTGFGAGSKMKFTYKSPAYNIFGDTSIAGAFGAQLRWAGYDHVVITGKAQHPVYLWINNDEVQIRDARPMWGKNTHEADEMIKEELADPGVEIVAIGQAGENLVRIASIISRSHRAGGRGGGGCVFGSKNLKAIAARGTKGLSIFDREGFFNSINDLLAWKMETPEYEQLVRFGTLRFTRMFDGLGFNTYRNFQGRELPEEAVNKLDHNWYTNNVAVRSWSCAPGCFISCGGWSYIKGSESPAAERYAGEWGVKPEYGAANPFGASCDVRDMSAVVHLTNMCNHYGMDTMEIGMGISFLMELWERELITEADTIEWTGEALSLNWGNYQTMEKIIEAIALKKNRLGEILHRGVYQAAKQIGQLRGVDVLKYAAYGKGGATHEGPARSWPKLALACAVSPIGAHHLKGLGLDPQASKDFFGNPKGGSTLGTTLLGAGHMVSENLAAVINSLGICNFVAGPVSKATLELLSRALQAAAGTKLTADELYADGERIGNIQKAFNSRLGLTRKDDALCKRWMNEPQLEGRSKGMKASSYLESAKDEYYEWRGWDRKTSLQTIEKLKELDLLDVAKVLEEENALA